jgi:ketosteroid isomerase-like protein
MKYLCLKASFLAWLVVSSLGAPASEKAVESAPRSNAEAAIRDVIATYTKSVDAADTTLASTIWANTPDVSFIHPMGHERGWEAIKLNLYQRTMGEMFSERKLTVKDVVIRSYGDTAWAEFYWDFAAKLRKDASPVTTHGRETQVYRKTGGRWLLVHVHYSGMPVTGNRQGF